MFVLPLRQLQKATAAAFCAAPTIWIVPLSTACAFRIAWIAEPMDCALDSAGAEIDPTSSTRSRLWSFLAWKFDGRNWRALCRYAERRGFSSFLMDAFELFSWVSWENLGCFRAFS